MLFHSPTALAAGDITVSASLSRQRAFVGDTVEFQITIDNATIDTPPTIDWPDALSARFVGPNSISRTSATIDATGRQQRITQNLYILHYRITPNRAGLHTIPPITLTIENRQYTTNAVDLIARNPVESSDYTLIAELDNTTLYVGGVARLRLTWLVAGEATLPSFNASDFPPSFQVLPSQQTRQQTNRRRRDTYAIDFKGHPLIARLNQTPRTPVLECDILFTPTEPGEFALGPMAAVFDITRRGRPSQRSISRSQPIAVHVLAPPDEGQPPGYTGLIGRYRIHASAAPTAVAVGDPIELTTTIRGDEPMPAVHTGPDLSAIPGFTDIFKPSPDGWTQHESTPGSRTFTTTIRARTPDVTSIPPIPLPYFDTDTGDYNTAATDPIPLAVRAVREITASDAIGGSSPAAPAPPTARPLDSADPAFWAEDRGPHLLEHAADLSLASVLTNPAWLTALITPPALTILTWLANMMRTRRDPTRARRARALTRALRTARRSDAPTAARTYLADMLARAPETISAAEIHNLPIKPSDRTHLADLLRTSEATRFSPNPQAQSAQQTDIRALLRRVDHALRSTAQ